MKFLTGIGAGLILLGIGFVIMDFFLARLAKRIGRTGVHDLSDQQMLITVTKPGERRRLKVANCNYDAAITHRMRRGGLIVAAAGAIILLGVSTFQLLTK